ncbi:MAG: PEP-CTERM sorting domain-containing protein [Bosea sp.]|uniref:PEPxxWA-CTERM sorting domain-containing protein n=1 Tax=Bosea sp. (in: a-proteobacteria) TaxID=1871050 RepID=UPI001AC63820|nr:PEPxxWA-CTERM sorting domain-containing protein [Bosea sp. (in: a-proteobacteria)]MBN9453274.1 PEP-CTERM sorting domain-containing protein [Bosea sp. (in: a-proteobacteria)]
MAMIFRALLASAAMAFAGALPTQAAMVTVQFSGQNWAALLSGGGYVADATPFSGSITYESSTLGVPYSSQGTRYNAITSGAFTYGADVYTAVSGYIDVHNSPSGGGADALFFVLFANGPSFNGANPFISYVALRDYTGVALSSQSLPTTFSLATFGGSNDFSTQYNHTPVGSSHRYGTVTDFAAAVPEPSTWAMMLVGFAGLGYAGYRKRKATPIAA